MANTYENPIGEPVGPVSELNLAVSGARLSACSRLPAGFLTPLVRAGIPSLTGLGIPTLTGGVRVAMSRLESQPQPERLAPHHQFSNCRTLCAWRLLAMNSWSLLSVISHRWLLSALILRT